MSRSLGDASIEINAPRELPSHARVRAALDTVRPGLLADGGNVELIEVDDDGTVKVVLQGACRQCPAAALTLRLVVESRLRAWLPGVTAVVAV